MVCEPRSLRLYSPLKMNVGGLYYMVAQVGEVTHRSLSIPSRYRGL